MSEQTRLALILLWVSNHCEAVKVFINQNRERLSRLVWWIGRITTWGEVLIGLSVWYFQGGMAWFMFAMSSIGEALSNEEIIRFQNFKKISNSKGDHHDLHHARLSVQGRIVNKRLAKIFLFLALSGPVITLFFGEIKPNDNLVTIVIALGLLLVTLLLAVAKWLLSEENQSARHDAKQTLICALSNLFVLATAYIQVYWSSFDLFSELCVSALLLMTAYKANKSEEPKCH